MATPTRKIESGVCRVCGCTEFDPCLLTLNFGGGVIDAVHCFWIDDNCTLCSNPACLAVVPLEEIHVEIFGARAAGAAGR